MAKGKGKKAKPKSGARAAQLITSDAALKKAMKGKGKGRRPPPKATHAEYIRRGKKAAATRRKNIADRRKGTKTKMPIGELKRRAAVLNRMIAGR
jgi:hypothetical protein